MAGGGAGTARCPLLGQPPITPSPAIHCLGPIVQNVLNCRLNTPPFCPESTTVNDVNRNIQVAIPDLHLGSIPLRATVWHASTGQYLAEGDRVLEISAGDVIVDIPAPAAGILRRRWVLEDDLVTPGQVVATIETAAQITNDE